MKRHMTGLTGDLPAEERAELLKFLKNRALRSRDVAMVGRTIAVAHSLSLPQRGCGYPSSSIRQAELLTRSRQHASTPRSTPP